MRCHHECGSVRSTCTLNARCAPRNCRSQHRHWCRAWRVHIPLAVVCDEAVVRRTLGLIAFVVIVVFVVAIFHRIFLYWKYTVYILVDMLHDEKEPSELNSSPAGGVVVDVPSKETTVSSTMLFQRANRTNAPHMRRERMSQNPCNPVFLQIPDQSE